MLALVTSKDPPIPCQNQRQVLYSHQDYLNDEALLTGSQTELGVKIWGGISPNSVCEQV